MDLSQFNGVVINRFMIFETLGWLSAIMGFCYSYPAELWSLCKQFNDTGIRVIGCPLYAQTMLWIFYFLTTSSLVATFVLYVIVFLKDLTSLKTRVQMFFVFVGVLILIAGALMIIVAVAEHDFLTELENLVIDTDTKRRLPIPIADTDTHIGNYVGKVIAGVFGLTAGVLSIVGAFVFPKREVGCVFVVPMNNVVASSTV